MNKNEKGAMLAELRELMKVAHREARHPSTGIPGTISLKAVQARRVVNAVKHVLTVGLSYSMERKDIPALFDELDRQAAEELQKEEAAHHDE